MIKENIPAGYKVFHDKNSTFILKEGFETLCDILDWKRPSQILSSYPLHTIQQGRGQAAIVPYQNSRDIFVKKLLHGGFLGNLFKDFFSRKRIVENLINAHSLKAESLHGPEIIFLIMRKKAGPCYEGYIGEEFLTDAENLLEMVVKDDWPVIKQKVLHDVASELKKFHDKGFYHRDLNAGNIMIRKILASKEGQGYEIFFIDLDKMKQYKKIGYSGRRRNIFRLFRSLRKFIHRERNVAEDDLLFLQYYSRDDTKMFKHFKRFLPLHRFSLIFHLPYWKFMAKR